MIEQLASYVGQIVYGNGVNPTSYYRIQPGFRVYKSILSVCWFWFDLILHNFPALEIHKSVLLNWINFDWHEIVPLDEIDFLQLERRLKSF